jgi:uncharacterized protein
MSTPVIPGVTVEESLQPSSASANATSTLAVFVAAYHQGPTEVTTLERWTEFTRLYGSFPSQNALLPYSVFNYLNNGGRRLAVLRVVGAGAAAADTTLSDRAAADPAATLEVAAANPGAWGNKLFVTVRDAGAEAFTLVVSMGNTAATATVVETFNDLSMDPESPRYVEGVLNAGATGSKYIVVTDLLSTNQTTIGYEGVRPAVTAEPVALTGGVNGAVPTSTEMIGAVEKLTAIAQPFVLNFPGVHDVAVVNAGLSLCEQTGRGFMVIDPPPGVDVAQTISYSESLQPKSYGGVYTPWIDVDDPASNRSGAVRRVPPGGAVAGIIASTDASRGVWKAPAGLEARIAGARALESSMTDDDLNDLYESNVNAIRFIPGAGIVVMGARTLKRTTADKFVPVRRTLIELRHQLINVTRWAAFEPNDRILWSTLEAGVSQYLTDFWSNGGLKGETPQQAFFVRCDSSINTPDIVEAGRVIVEVGVALRYPAEFIIIRLSQWEGGSSDTEEAPTTDVNVSL